MPILQNEHKVAKFDGWKKAFDSDPVNRKKSGVRRYRIFRLANDPEKILIPDLKNHGKGFKKLLV
jgi:hypothetical protein